MSLFHCQARSRKLLGKGVPNESCRGVVDQNEATRFTIQHAKKTNMWGYGHIRPPSLKKIHGIHPVERGNPNKSLNPRREEAFPYLC